MHKLCPYIAKTMTNNNLADHFLQTCEEPILTHCLDNRLALRWELALSYELTLHHAEEVVDAIIEQIGKDIPTRE